MQELSPSRAGGGPADPSRRAAKRQRVSRTACRPTPAALALLERVASIRAVSLELRDDHRALIDDFDRRSAAKRAAAKAAATVTAAKPAPDVLVFSQGDAIRQDAVRPAPPPPRLTPARPPLPAMSLLVEQEPPEKVMVEQSVIWRAHMINRRNAELARERLPKQPEAQRGKTHWDYVLDEAVWLANDFREERKWKMQMAKKVSKMIMQHHAQHAQRLQRARRDEQVRLIRLASGVARDVRKFWNQIREVADYRKAVVREAELAAEREDQLEFLLKQTEAYTNVLATSLSAPKPASAPGEAAESDPEPAAAPASAPPAKSPGRRVTRNRANTPQMSSTAAEGTATATAVGATRKRSRGQFENGPAGGADDEFGAEELDDADAEDDEATMRADEAAEEDDPEEIQRLEGDAALTVEELLREQGIDPAAYREDTKSYADSSSSAASGSASSEDEAEDDDEASDDGGHGAADRDGGADAVRDPVADVTAPVAAARRADPFAPAADPAATDAAPAAPPAVADEASLTLDTAVERYRQTGEPEAEGDAREGVIVASDVSGQGVDAGAAAGEMPSGGSVAPSSADPDAMDVDESSAAAPSGASQAPSSPPALSVPSTLLRGTLRDYQRVGMEWLVTMYNQKLNGILADEMGLGKTIQTISLLAWLAVERGVWGPHLVVVPTSVMINWEVEFKKWLPGFKVVTYYGSMKERRAKRQGWSKPNAFHVCITSYNLVVQDAAALRRKKWLYLILDEAHNIKNFQSQRWQTLLNFPSRRRLLLTGTPLQNSVMELWSLMHFLMPDVFRSHAEFKDWFSKPLHSMVTEGQQAAGAAPTGVVANLHRVLRPFLLRRLKADVEKGLPGKFEHVVPCPLSKRQRQLYEDFMSRTDIKETLNSGDFIGVMNVLMQLRKVCNHPDLFEGRPIVSPFALDAIFFPAPKLAVDVLGERVNRVDLPLLGLDLASEESRGWPGAWYVEKCAQLSASGDVQQALEQVRDDDFLAQVSSDGGSVDSVTDSALQASRRAAVARRATLRRNTQLSDLRTRRKGMLGADVIAAATMTPSRLVRMVDAHRAGQWDACPTPALDAVWDVAEFASRASAVTEKFVFAARPAVAPVVEMRFVGDDRRHRADAQHAANLARLTSPLRLLFRSYEVRSKVTLPDARLVQWDCGKLQVLDGLLRRLKKGGHRVLVFTQMTRVLDILESFLNLHAHRYLRLDGATKTEERQRLVERFNTDKRVFCMILTTRAGGLGLNLTGADTVVFYDTDYNPSMDAQAQDRAHRIGQTRPVHIYRLVSQQTVEENILRRAQQKRTLEDLVISKAGFTTEGFRQKLDVMALVTPDGGQPPGSPANGTIAGSVLGAVTQQDCGPGAAGTPIAGATAGTGASEPGCGAAAGPAPAVVAADEDADDDVDATLLAVEDEREGLAAAARRREEKLALAEFDDDAPEPSVAVKVAAVNDPGDADASRDIVSALTPLQVFALKLVEAEAAAAARAVLNGDVAVRAIDDERGTQDLPDWHKDFSLEEMLRRHEDDELGSGASAAVDGAEKYGEGDEETDNDGAEELVYELDTTEAGQEAYLKALTDTDADIKLYLPLRDGDPEELKKSAVVNGTAAAGLECAEDAAFFPHAYNRMSRTQYATRRQKEKAAANLKRRLLEENKIKAARERQEAVEAAKKAAAAAAAAAVKAGDSLGDKLKGPNKGKGPLVHASAIPGAGAVGSKRPRDSGAPGSRRPGHGGPGLQGAGMSAEGGSSGLFTRPAKKAKAKAGLTFHGKSGVGAGIQVTKEEIGLNDRWTAAEERQLLELVNVHNKNMALVADSLSFDPHVAAGLRMSRGYKRCIDRMKTLTKDVKSGPPVGRAVAKDVDNMRQHSKALAVAARVVRTPPAAWARSTAPADNVPHPSHLTVATDAAAQGDGRFPKGPPTLAAVGNRVVTPEYHRAGMKSADCTAAAIARKRRPFMRPRAVSERRPGAPPPPAPDQRPTASPTGLGTGLSGAGPRPGGRQAGARGGVPQALLPPGAPAVPGTVSGLPAGVPPGAPTGVPAGFPAGVSAGVSLGVPAAAASGMAGGAPPGAGRGAGTALGAPPDGQLPRPAHGAPHAGALAPGGVAQRGRPGVPPPGAAMVATAGALGALGAPSATAPPTLGGVRPTVAAAEGVAAAAAAAKQRQANVVYKMPGPAVAAPPRPSLHAAAGLPSVPSGAGGPAAAMPRAAAVVVTAAPAGPVGAGTGAPAAGPPTPVPLPPRAVQVATPPAPAPPEP